MRLTTGEPDPSTQGVLGAKNRANSDRDFMLDEVRDGRSLPGILPRLDEHINRAAAGEPARDPPLAADPVAHQARPSCLHGLLRVERDVRLHAAATDGSD